MFLGAAVLGGRIFAVGGDDGVTHLNSAECYDAQLNEWGEVVSSVQGKLLTVSFECFCQSVDYWISAIFSDFLQSLEGLSRVLLGTHCGSHLFNGMEMTRSFFVLYVG
jgi:hypothetical protein